VFSSCFFFTATPSPAIYTLSLHDALPFFRSVVCRQAFGCSRQKTDGDYSMSHLCDISCRHTLLPDIHRRFCVCAACRGWEFCPRSEEHTSELQSRFDLVCRLLLEKKK